MPAGDRQINEEHGLATASLDAASIDAVARRVVELLSAEPAPTEGLIGAAEVARRFGIPRSTVYDRAGELGAIRLGDGPKARLRFDPQTVAERLAVAAHREGSGERVSPPGSRRGSRTRRENRVPLLEVRRRGPR